MKKNVTLLCEKNITRLGFVRMSCDKIVYRGSKGHMAFTLREHSMKGVYGLSMDTPYDYDDCDETDIAWNIKYLHQLKGLMDGLCDSEEKMTTQK